MTNLGYSSYIAQGGDWGSLVCRKLGQLYPQNCKAIHLNMLVSVGTPRFLQGPLIWLKWVTGIGPLFLYDKREIASLRLLQKFDAEESGYQVLVSPTFLDIRIWLT